MGIVVFSSAGTGKLVKVEVRMDEYMRFMDEYRVMVEEILQGIVSKPRLQSS